MSNTVKQLEPEVSAMSVEDQSLVSNAMQRLRQYLETGASQSEVARKLGLSAAVMSGFLKGTYRGNVLLVAQKIVQLLDQEQIRSEAPKKPGFVETSVVKQVQFCCSYAHMHQDIAVVYGDAGLGKTMALKNYAENNQGVVYMAANPTMSSQRGLLEELMDALGKDDLAVSRRMRKTIVRALKGTNWLLVVDEAQHLSEKALETLRSIYDETGIGLVIAGNRHVYQKIFGHREATFAQFFSRVGVKREIKNTIPRSDVDALIGNQTEEIRDFFHRAANLPGGIRWMMKLYILAATDAHARKEVMNLEHVKRARQLLMPEQR